MRNNASKAAQRAASDVDFLVNGIGLLSIKREAGLYHDTQGFNLSIINRGRYPADAYYVDYSRDGQDGKAPFRIEAAKEIPGKQREHRLLCCPPASTLVRQEDFIAPAVEGGGANVLPVALNPYGKPPISGCDWCR